MPWLITNHVALPQHLHFMLTASGIHSMRGRISVDLEAQPDPSLFDFQHRDLQRPFAAVKAIDDH